MKLTMIRHTSVDVPKGICYGQTDVPLSHSFEEEAELVKCRLLPDNFDAVYCSPLSRCRRLAEYCGFKDAIADPRLMELNFGNWEMQSFDKIEDPMLQLWYEDYVNTPIPGGESFLDQQKRLLSFLREISESGKQKIAAFTHGGIIMQTKLLTGLATLDNLFSHQPPYGAVEHFDIDLESIS